MKVKPQSRLKSRVKPDEEPDKKRAAILRILCNGQKLHRVGNSYMLLLPAAWARLYSWQVDDGRWVKLTSSSGNLLVEPIDRVHALEVMEANNVKPI